jgi:parallel beta-helix repeat protein
MIRSLVPRVVVLLVAGVLAALPVAANPPCGSTLPAGSTVLDGPMTCPGTALIASNGSTLDCAFNTITGPDIPPPSCNPIVPGCVTGHWGIRVDGKSNVTILRCAITQFERGIYVTNSTAVSVKKNTLHNNTRYGAQLSGSGDNNLLSYNMYVSNRDEGVHISDLTGAGNRSAYDQAIDNVAEGFYLLFADALKLSDCKTDSNGAPGLYLKNSRGVDVVRCTFTADNVQVIQDTGVPLVINHLATGL